mgnify:FL=1|jgi:hypothetical protein
MNYETQSARKVLDDIEKCINTWKAAEIEATIALPIAINSLCAVLYACLEQDTAAYKNLIFPLINHEGFK